MTAKPKGGAFFPTLFLVIGALFLCILAFVYVRTRQTTIVMLDEKGQPRNVR